MSASESRSALVLELAEEFLARYRQGQRPSLKEYIDRHPDLVAEIREVFPAMALMENVALDDESLAGEATGPASVDGAAPPEQLGDYRILREVGRGGMGIVYEAEQVSLGRHVALKVLPRKVLLDEAQKRRFEREAKAAAKLHHTNIVPVFGVGEHEGLPYYVMQFIQGLGLDDVLDELKRMQGSGAATGGEVRVSRKDVSAADIAHSLVAGAFPRGERGASVAGGGAVSPPSESRGANGPPSEESATSKLSSSSVVLPGVKGKKASYWQSVAHIGVQVADALEYAHKQGIQHRDIKPSNLLLDTAGTVWVTDFGLARADNEDHLTQTGDIVGTLRYMPPEAFEGHTDKRGDIYSLGLTLYEMLARRPAFDERERHRLIKRVTTEEPPRLDKLHRSIPRDLVTIVHKAIDREPGRRYQTAGELSADLRRFLDDEPIQARRISNGERLRRWCRHHPGVATLTATLAVILLGITVVSLVAAARFDGLAKQKDQLAEQEKQTADNERYARQAAEQAKTAAEEAKKQEAAQRRRAENALYYSRIALAERAWQANDVSTTERLLDRAVQGRNPGERSDWEWRYLKGLCHAELLTLSGHQNGSPYTVAYSPDGRFLVSASRSYFAGNPGQRITGEVIVWDARTGQRLRTLDSSSTVWPWIAAYSLDGNYLAILIAREGPRSPLSAPWVVEGDALAVSLYKPHKVWDTRSWAEVAPTALKDVAFRRQIPLRARIDRDAIRLATTSGERLETLRGHVGNVNCVDVDEPAHRLASCGIDNTVRVWDIDKGAPLAIFRGHVRSVDAVAFSPDGSRLASASLDGTIKIWDLGRDPRGLRVQATNQWGGEWLATFAFSGDSRRIHALALDGPGACLRSLDVIGGRFVERGNLDSFSADLYNFAFVLSPSGDRAAGPRHDERNALSIGDRATGRELAVLRGHTGPITVAAFSPDGRLVATASASRGEVKLWDSASGKEVIRLEQPTTGRNFRARSLAISPDGKRLAAGPAGASGIWVWDVANGHRLAVLRPQITFSSCLTFNGDGKKLAVVIPGHAVEVLDAATGKLLFAAPAPSGLEWVAFSPDGRRLAGVGQHGLVYLWDADSGQDILVLARLSSPPPGDYGFVARVTFSPDGSRLAANNWDGTLSIWSAEDLTPARPAPRPEPPERSGPTLGLADLNRQLKDRPSDARLYLERGRFLARRNRRKEAEADFIKAVELNPDDADAWKERGRMRFALGQKDKAAADFRKAVELLGENALPDEPVVSASDKLYTRLADEALLPWLTAAIQRHPEDMGYRRQRGEWYARHRRWKEAAADFTLVPQRQPPDEALQWLHLVPAVMAAGDREGYRRLCREMLKRFGETHDHVVAERISKACLLLPEAAQESDPACRLADRGTTLGKGIRYVIFSKGLADYRRRNYRAAAEEFESLVPRFADAPHFTATCHAVLSMALHRQGASKAAREQLTRADKLLDAFVSDPDRFPAFEDFRYDHDWLIAWLLHREARALIEGKQTESQK